MIIQYTYNLFLDDFRTPTDAYLTTKNLNYNLLKWVVVRSYDEFCSYIFLMYSKGEFPKIISLDHDLADEHYDTTKTSIDLEKTGYHCAKWLCEFCIDNNIKISETLVHSMNPVGKKNIEDTITSFKKYFPELS